MFQVWGGVFLIIFDMDWTLSSVIGQVIYFEIGVLCCILIAGITCPCSYLIFLEKSSILNSFKDFWWFLPRINALIRCKKPNYITLIKEWIFLAEISGQFSGLEKKGTLTRKLEKVSIGVLCTISNSFRYSVLSFTDSPIVGWKYYY